MSELEVMCYYRLILFTLIDATILKLERHRLEGETDKLRYSLRTIEQVICYLYLYFCHRC